MNQINKNHSQKRTIIRILGIIILIVGIYFVVTGIQSEQERINNFYNNSRQDSQFGYIFIGMLMIFIGLVLTLMGFAGSMARFQAQELAPVGKDVLNYMVDGTKDSIKTVARSISEGIGGTHDKTVTCSKCRTENDSDATFCKGCGERVVTHKTCTRCGVKNDGNASYCDNCGSKLE